VETTAAGNVPNEISSAILIGNKKISEWGIVYREYPHLARSSELASRGGTNFDDAYNGLIQEGLKNVGIFTNNTFDFIVIYGYGTRMEALSHLDEFKNKKTPLGEPGYDVRVIYLRSICESGVFVPNKLGDYVCR
jgi:hypothetical protein